MSKNIRTEAVDHLFEAILCLKDKEECYTFFEDVCTINELLSLSQRFEVAKMLMDKRTYLDISEKTGASTATISRVNRSLNYGNDGYDMVFKRIEEKKEQIRDLYLECLGDMPAELPLNMIYNSKWENAASNPPQIRREMMERKETVKQGLDAIRQMHSDAEEKAVAMFLESYDLTKSILYINQYEQQQKAILAREQERIRHEEEERIRREERAKLESEQREREALARAERETQEALAAAEAEKLAAVEQAKEEAAQEVIDSMIPQDLDANAYAWVLMSKIADAQEYPTTKEEIYEKMLKDYGVLEEVDGVPFSITVIACVDMSRITGHWMLIKSNGTINA